jgi:hypothetical protein
MAPLRTTIPGRPATSRTVAASGFDSAGPALNPAAVVIESPTTNARKSNSQRSTW